MLGGHTRAWRALCRGPRAGTVPAASPPIPARTPITRPLYRRPRTPRPASAPCCIPLHPAALRCVPLHYTAFHLPATGDSALVSQRARSGPASSPPSPPSSSPIVILIDVGADRGARGCCGVHAIWRVRDRVDRRATGDGRRGRGHGRGREARGEARGVGADGRTRRGRGVRVRVREDEGRRAQGARVQLDTTRRGEGAESRGGQIEPGGASARRRGHGVYLYACLPAYLLGTVLCGGRGGSRSVGASKLEALKREA
ncbi:hypothetical protein HETIRDRAFT_478056 [Heterobasidion irregulare TC 32-1]|uniref:Uncharacterized protein n=1 Tax=Heterobasidion irregulare (strain TC 32-1) TaxID=747525 RepID=W4K0D8_HETIT|nr:uncharacterized protein HETIRDRAFT_478056 [Heterobasidion irregulare TC 32-1]ETW78775.1 hypothetical protein HETIRDRAFT_478056 [Heterobasidion irregulare TC 32-1]